MNRQLLRDISFIILAFAIAISGAVVTDASPSPAPKKNKKQAKTDPLLAQSLMRQGYVFMQQQRYEEALERFSEADDANPGNATVYNMSRSLLSEHGTARQGPGELRHRPRDDPRFHRCEEQPRHHLPRARAVPAGRGRFHRRALGLRPTPTDGRSFTTSD